LADIIVACALGEKPNARPRLTGTAAAIRFITGPAGIVSAVDLPEVDIEGGIREVRSYVKPGDETTGRSSSIDRLGHVIVTGANRAEADARADSAIARVRVEIASIPQTQVQETNMRKTILLVGGANLPAVREAAERRG